LHFIFQDYTKCKIVLKASFFTNQNHIATAQLAINIFTIIRYSLYDFISRKELVVIELLVIGFLATVIFAGVVLFAEFEVMIYEAYRANN